MHFLLIYTNLLMYAVVKLRALVCVFEVNILRLFEISLQLHNHYLIRGIQLFVET
jgi:hypothetical protein